MQKFRRISAELAVPVLFSGALRIFHLQRSSFWLDEMTSLDLASQSGLRAAFSDNNPPLYHFILKVWIVLFGNGEVSARSLSVLFSVVATVFVMKAVAEIRKDGRAVLLAGFLHAFCVLSLTYAQEARMYSLFEMWTAISLFYFLRLYRSPGAILGFGISCVGMALTHYFAVIPISIELVFLLFFSRSLARGQKTRLVLLLALLAGVQAWLYSRFFKWDGLQWQTLKSSAEPVFFWPRELLISLSNRSFLVGGIFGLAWCLGALQMFSIPEEERGQRSSLVALVLLPVLAVSAASLMSARALLLPRYFIFLAPPFCVFLALVRIRRRSFAAAVAGLLLVGSLAGLRDYYSLRKEPWRDVAAIIQRYPGSVVYTTRTLALRTPYFTRIGVPVKKLQLGDPGQLADVTADVAQGRKVWILENFWGGYPYMAELKRVFEGMHFDVSELSLRDEDSSPVLVMVVESRKS